MCAERVLLLGGTAEARALGTALAGAGVPAVTSLAGVTDGPARIDGPLRVGGFGGVAGMAAYLRAERMAGVIDATHPFAARISANAVQAAAEAGVPLARLRRAPWVPGAGDRWQAVTDLAAAVAALPAGAHGFVAAGRSAVAQVRPANDVRLTLRMIEPPEAPLPPGVEVLLARPPFAEAAEAALFKRLKITHLICKNAGGHAGTAKLAAARGLGLPVLMIPPPALPPAPTVLDGIDAAVAWARGCVGNGKVKDAPHA